MHISSVSPPIVWYPQHKPSPPFPLYFSDMVSRSLGVSLQLGWLAWPISTSLGLGVWVCRCAWLFHGCWGSAQILLLAWEVH